MQNKDKLIDLKDPKIREAVRQVKDKTSCGYERSVKELLNSNMDVNEAINKIYEGYRTQFNADDILPGNQNVDNLFKAIVLVYGRERAIYAYGYSQTDFALMSDSVFYPIVNYLGSLLLAEGEEEKEKIKLRFIRNISFARAKLKEIVLVDEPKIAEDKTKIKAEAVIKSASLRDEEIEIDSAKIKELNRAFMCKELKTKD